MPVPIEEIELDVPDVDHVSTDNREEMNETSNDLVIPYSFPCISASSTCKKLVYGSYNIIRSIHTHTHAHTHACTHAYTHIITQSVML